MTSTGEVGCLGRSVEEAFLKALLSVGFNLPIRKVLISAGPARSKESFLDCCRIFQKSGIQIFATTGTHIFLEDKGIQSERLAWPNEKDAPDVLDSLNEKNSYDLVINIPKNLQETELTNTYRIRRKAVDLGIPLLTNLELAIQFAKSIEACEKQNLEVLAYDSYKTKSLVSADTPVSA